MCDIIVWRCVSGGASFFVGGGMGEEIDFAIIGSG